MIGALLYLILFLIIKKEGWISDDIFMEQPGLVHAEYIYK